MFKREDGETDFDSHEISNYIYICLKIKGDPFFI